MLSPSLHLWCCESCKAYAFSCTTTWCTWWTVYGTAVELCWRTGPPSRLHCYRTLPHAVQVGKCVCCQFLIIFPHQRFFCGLKGPFKIIHNLHLPHSGFQLFPPQKKHVRSSVNSCFSKYVCVYAGFTLAEQAVLVEILVASVRQASEGPVLAGRSGAKKVSGRSLSSLCMWDSTLITHHLKDISVYFVVFQVMSARDKKIQNDDCLKLTEHLLTVLPKLLSKVFIPHVAVAI